MGHANVQTTMQYLHYVPRPQDAALVGRAFEPSPPRPTSSSPARAASSRPRRGFVLRFMLEIHPSARKHGIADEDIEHAVTHAMAIDDTDDDTRLYLGPARNAALLEVLTFPHRGLRARHPRHAHAT